MKKLTIGLVIAILLTIITPFKTLASGGIYASGGGTKTVGQTFTVNVTASGDAFDTISGTISISGPVSVVSFSPGSATWINTPTNGGSFNGAFLGDKKTSFTVATIKLKGTGIGSGAVSVSGASLKNAGSVVGSGASSANFTIEKAADLPGAVKVTSTSHPDPNTAYEATTIALAWNKDSGVDAFSYLLDQTEGTTPAAKTTDANTSATYADKAIGTYYFHIRAHKADGWGTATTFKINIKEPDAKINETLAKPSEIKIERDSSAINNIDTGTLTGVIITGKTEPGYTANLVFDPVPTIPEGKTLTAVADTKGNFKVLIDYPIKAGLYKLTVQGQMAKVLTPISDPIKFEISLKDGGVINIITKDDINPPAKTIASAVKGAFLKQEFSVMTYLIVTLILVILTLIVIESVKFFKRRRQRAQQG